MTTPKCPQKGPYKTEVKAGKTYYWCTCGLSTKQPFCDGSHKGSGFKSLAWTAESSGAVYFCGCKASKTSPLCDGSHSAL